MAACWRGKVQMFFAQSSAALQQIKAGNVVALGVASPKRIAAAPDLPTIAEAGLPGFDVTSWYALVAPAGTPPPIVGSCSTAIAAALARPDVREQDRGPRRRASREHARRVRRDAARGICALAEAREGSPTSTPNERRAVNRAQRHSLRSPLADHAMPRRSIPLRSSVRWPAFASRCPSLHNNRFASARRTSPSSSCWPNLCAGARGRRHQGREEVNLGGTLIAHKALEEKQIDFYPEYTGTMLLAVLKQPHDERSARPSTRR